MDWDALAAGQDCPFCRPRVEPNDFWDTVTELPVSTLCLLKNQTYRGYCILIYDVKHTIAPDQLTETEWSRFTTDVHRAVKALRAVCSPDHMNVECLGNTVPHLHWHLIPRYRNDPRWSGPIWTDSIDDLHRVELPSAERSELMALLRACFDNRSVSDVR
jgi:diadenosine tetraphosphate (Ap4A) HIT family hydrolase